MNVPRDPQLEIFADRPLLLLAAGVADGAGLRATPGAVLLTPSRTALGACSVAAAGLSDDVGRHPHARGAEVREFPNAVLIPALVNAHAHLDLTHIGPRAYDPTGGFAGWAEMVIRGRAREAEAVRSSVRSGTELSRAGGVAAVGDIAGVGRLEPTDEFLRSGLLGASFVEYFGFGGAAGESARAAAAALRGCAIERSGAPVARIGLSPHAPYSAGPALYDALIDAAAGAGGAPLSTHLAESPEEAEFVARGTGAFRALAERLGVWDEAAARAVGRGEHPIRHLSPALARSPMLLAHVNDCPDEGLETIARSGSSVVWCPRGHEYFGRSAEFGAHRWREMLRLGINVCLGTDSILNLPAEDVTGADARLSPLDDARLLWRRGERDATLLLSLITTNGARALGLDPSQFAFTPGPIAGIVAPAIDDAGRERLRAGDPAGAVMASRGAPGPVMAARAGVGES